MYKNRWGEIRKGLYIKIKSTNNTENILHSCSIVKQHDKDNNNFYSHIMNIQDLSCRLNINNKYKLLLKNINISICSNEMIALLAPSGAGKS